MSFYQNFYRSRGDKAQIYNYISMLLSCGVAQRLHMTISSAATSRTKKNHPRPLVTVSHPKQESVTDYLDLTGTAAASQSVDLGRAGSGLFAVH